MGDDFGTITYTTKSGKKRTVKISSVLSQGDKHPLYKQAFMMSIRHRPNKKSKQTK